MPLRPNLRRWFVILAPTAVILGACADAPTRIAGPAPADAVRASLTPTSGIPTGKTVVVFRDTSSIPVAGLTLISSLGGTVTKRWDNIGVAFVSGLSASALTSLSASALIASVGNDRILNWLPRVRTAGAIQGDVANVYGVQRAIRATAELRRETCLSGRGSHFLGDTCANVGQ